MVSDLTWPVLVAVGAAQDGQGTGGFTLPPAVGIAAVFVLVLLNGFFVATEFALVAVRRSRIEQLAAEGHRTAPAVRQALEHLDTYIAATQLGITMASLALGWLGEPALAGLIEGALLTVLPPEIVGISSHAIAIAIAFALITMLHIVLGELAPKGIALQRPEATSLWVVVPITIFLRIFRPFIMGLNGIGNMVLRLLGLPPASEDETVHSVEELRYLVKSSRKAGLLDIEEEEIVNRALNLGDLTAHAVMVPRTSMVTVPYDISREELFRIAGETHHTRFPVYRGNHDSIEGVIHITDIFAWESANPGKMFIASEVMRPALLVPESAHGDRILAQMRSARSHTAVVIDEFGGLAGMITLQDLLERIVGEIPEMDETDAPDVEMLPDGSARIDGLAPVSTLHDRFDLDIEEAESDTVGGYVLEVMGRVPEEGDEVKIEEYKLRVERMDGPRVAEVVLTK